jgi:hypothetical protein
MSEQKKLFLIQETAFLTRWSHLGSNQGPPDYESVFCDFDIFCFPLVSIVNKEVA